MESQDAYEKFKENKNSIKAFQENELLSLLKYLPPDEKNIKYVLDELISREIENKNNVLRFLLHMIKSNCFKRKCKKAIIALFSPFHGSVFSKSKNLQIVYNSPEIFNYNYEKVKKSFIEKKFTEDYYSFIESFKNSIFSKIYFNGISEENVDRCLENFLKILRSIKKRKNDLKIKNFMKNNIPIYDESYMFLVRYKFSSDYLKFLISVILEKKIKNKYFNIIKEVDDRWKDYYNTEYIYEPNGENINKDYFSEVKEYLSFSEVGPSIVEEDFYSKIQSGEVCSVDSESFNWYNQRSEIFKKS